MYPWFWIWSPTVNYPWSGSVAQNIDPETTWFSNTIKPSAGNAEIEEKAFNVASYGTQIGLITDILLHTINNKDNLPKEAQQSLSELSEINEKIKRIKISTRKKAHKKMIDEFIRLKKNGGEDFDDMVKDLQKLLPKME